MSGPKVVRIVTREELELICRHHMAQLDEAIGALRSLASRLGCLELRLERELERQRQVLEHYFRDEQWEALQKRAPELIAGLRVHADRLRSEATAAAAAARSRHRRLAEGARSLIRALEAQRLPVVPALRAAVTQALTASDEQLAAIQTVMNSALEQLRSKAQDPVLSTGQQALAQRLAAGTEERSLAMWLATTPPPPDRDARLDGLLAEIEARGHPETLHAFTGRAATIMANPDERNRALLTDSLILDAGQWVAEQQKADRQAGRLREARARLAPFAGEAAAGLSREIAAALAASNFRHSDQLCAAASDLAEREASSASAEARRRAVLEGLAALGYEVRATMATAWAQDGRVVLRKPASYDYGVELGAAPDLARLQIRLVGADQPQQPRNASRDRDQEVIWCGEFDQLRTELAARGSDLIIERALDVGAQALKTVALPASSGQSVDSDIAAPIKNYRQ